MVKWASTLNTSKFLSLQKRWTTISSDVTNITFMWWAERNGLKVYALPPEGNKWKTKFWIVKSVLIPENNQFSPKSRPKRDSQ